MPGVPATQFDALTAQLDDEDKMVDILRKTAAKMSPQGLAAAGTLALSPDGSALLARWTPWVDRLDRARGGPPRH